LVLTVRRTRGVVLLAVALVFVLIVAIGYPFYVEPQTDPLRSADAIVVLGGPGHERYPRGLELALAGYAPHLVMSNPSGAKDRWLTDLCTHRRYEFDVSCFEPDPPTTRGEARELRRLAEANNWHTVIVVTFTPHISRARYILSRCYDGELIMRASPADVAPGYWVFSYAYQTAGYVRAALQPGC
jgi:uncharacterized SAM-binding protein YcdF (DUF218 family)